MAFGVKTRAELLAQYPTVPNTKDITGDKLKDFVVSSQVYGGKVEAITGTQTVDIAGTVLTFGADELSEGVAPLINSLAILYDGRYEVGFMAHALIQNVRVVAVGLSKNAAPEVPLTSANGNGDIVAMVGATVLDLVVGDVLTLVATADANGTDFFMGAGTRFYARRLL